MARVPETTQPTASRSVGPAPAQVCAWCGTPRLASTRPAHGAPVSHGLCRRCAQRLRRRDAARTR